MAGDGVRGEGTVEVMTPGAVARALDLYRMQVVDGLAKREFEIATVDGKAAVLVTPALRERLKVAQDARQAAAEVAQAAGAVEG